MLAAGATAASLFFVLWWMLHSSGDEAPWLPAGLAASVVMLVAAAARQVVMRRAWTRYILEQDRREPSLKSSSSTTHKSGASSASSKGSKSDAYYAALRAVQKKSADADAGGEQPEAHLEAYHLCKDYLANTEEALRTTSAADVRAALRAGQERVRALQKKHLLAWTRGESTRLTHEAQRRVRISDKIETAQQALEVIDEALRVYPGEGELRASAMAVRNFIASVKVGQWVEMAERAAFRGKYARAVARYRDALFYLSRADMSEDARDEAANRIHREIEMLRARVATSDDAPDGEDGARSSRRK